MRLPSGARSMFLLLTAPPICCLSNHIRTLSAMKECSSRRRHDPAIQSLEKQLERGARPHRVRPAVIRNSTCPLCFHVPSGTRNAAGSH